MSELLTTFTLVFTALRVAVDPVNFVRVLLRHGCRSRLQAKFAPLIIGGVIFVNVTIGSAAYIRMRAGDAAQRDHHGRQHEPGALVRAGHRRGRVDEPLDLLGCVRRCGGSAGSRLAVGPYSGGLLATALYWYLFQSKVGDKTYEKFQGESVMDDDKDDADAGMITVQDSALP